MMKNTPLVTVYIPTYNRLNLLKRAIKSVLIQDYPEIEIIVVDDGSTDGTVEYLEQLCFDHSMIRYFVNERNLGPCVSRNKAIKAAKGEFVTGLDDDDYFHPRRISLLMSNYRPGLSFVMSNYYLVESGKLKVNSYVNRRVTSERLKMRNFSSQALVPKDKALGVGGYDEALEASQDLDFWLRLTLKYGPGFKVRDALYYTDISHDGERIGISEKRRQGTVSFINKYVGILPKEVVLYKEDCYLNPSNKPSTIFGYLLRYGFKLTFELLRWKVKLG